MLFDQFSTLIQAAVVGLGVALLPALLVEEELSSGTLVKAMDRPLRSCGSYYLVWPKERGAYPPLVKFRNWLSAECAVAASKGVVSG
ncbi:LysR substrate-binding domain-containing protein [Sphingomonas cavernae]|uniref:LysR substrate-binding domain-containing protein n=1 Tax=Sphingomonas cavernae TaxID=2320861 RepID=A0A418WJM6_9SPHN|nr:LysR substrate-binding domain-containing protein [Sphingomonas cavernae]RJF90246.1 hypothetical protein D3876_08170 [Sphingomonas cavernae]